LLLTETGPSTAVVVVFPETVVERSPDPVSPEMSRASEVGTVELVEFVVTSVAVKEIVVELSETSPPVMVVAS